MGSKRQWQAELYAVRALTNIGAHALEAAHEDEFLGAAAATLRDYAGADAVLVRILDWRIETRAVADENGTTVLCSGDLSAPFTAEDEQFWLAHAGGYFCENVATSPVVKPEFRDHVLRLGLRSAHIVPMIRNGEVLGRVMYGWKAVPSLTDAQVALLRELTGYTALQFSLLQWKYGSDRDPMTGLLNWHGLRRRWERFARRRKGAALFVEISNFRSFVDAHGSLAGDDLLRLAARTVKEIAGAASAVGRLGGDAFVALLADVSERDVSVLAGEIVDRFDAAMERRRQLEPYLTVGAATWPPYGRDLKTLVEAAEKSAYERKRRRAELTMTTQGDPARGRLPRMFLQGWLASTDDGVIIADANLKVIYVNPAYERMSGYKLREWVGKAPGFIASGKTPLHVYEDMWKNLNTRGTWTGQLINRRPTGEEWVSYLTVTRILDRRGRRVGYLGIARNVNELDSDAVTPKPSLAAFEDVVTKEGLTLALSRAATIHSGDSREHLERVRWFTHLLVAAAAEEGLEEFRSYEFRSSVTLASVLHDVGKLALPRELLQKRGRLADYELELMKTHTVAGRELLRSSFLHENPAAPVSSFLEVAADIAGSHHEKWDGSGYPEGLAGTKIPTAARVVAIADVYDALRCRRTYRQAWSHAEAVNYIAGQAGKHFDPRLTELFLSVSDAFEQVFERLPDRYRTVTV